MSRQAQPLKHCRWCEQTKPLGDVYEPPMMADGHLNKCKECVRSYIRERHRDRIENDPVWRESERRRGREKNRRRGYRHGSNHRKRPAQHAVSNAVRDGRLVPAEACEDCGHDFTEFRREAHHEDYDKPLDVKWLCSLCHGKRHRGAA